MDKQNLKIANHIGTWYVIDEAYYRGKEVYLLESEVYGDEAACLIVDSSLNLIHENVWNGFADLDDLED